MAAKASAQAPVEESVPPQETIVQPSTPETPATAPEAIVAPEAPKPPEAPPEAPAKAEVKDSVVVLVQEGQILPEAPQVPDTNDVSIHIQHAKESVVESLAQLVGGKITALVEDSVDGHEDLGEPKTYGLQIEIEQIQGPNIILIAWIQADAEGSGPGFLAIENKGARRG